MAQRIRCSVAAITIPATFSEGYEQLRVLDAKLRGLAEEQTVDAKEQAA